MGPHTQTTEPSAKCGDVFRPRPPSLKELGDDLLRVAWRRQLFTLAVPFLAMAGYVLFAWYRSWSLAIASVMMLSFVTYGSTSHDLVHRTLRLPRRLNDGLLSLIEFLSLRSGTAYRLSHLHHHRHLLEEDDVEGATAHGSLLHAIASGPTAQFRLWLWAWHNYNRMRPRLLLEGVGIVVLIILGAVAMRWHRARLFTCFSSSWVAGYFRSSRFTSRTMGTPPNPSSRRGFSEVGSCGCSPSTISITSNITSIPQYHTTIGRHWHAGLIRILSVPESSPVSADHHIHQDWEIAGLLFDPGAEAGNCA